MTRRNALSALPLAAALAFVAGCELTEEELAEVDRQHTVAIRDWYLASLESCSKIEDASARLACISETVDRAIELFEKKDEAFASIEKCDTAGVEGPIADGKGVMEDEAKKRPGNFGDVLGPGGFVDVAAPATRSGPDWIFGPGAWIAWSKNGEPFTVAPMGGWFRPNLAPDGAGGFAGPIVDLHLTFPIEGQPADFHLLPDGQGGEIQIDASGQGVLSFHASAATPYLPGPTLFMVVPIQASGPGLFHIDWTTAGPVPAEGVFPRIELDSLTAEVDTISVTAGGVQTLTLDAGPEHAFSPYLLLGSATDMVPGLVVDSHLLPLQVDTYFFHTLTNPNSPPLLGSLGLLDPLGTGSAAVVVPPGSPPSLAGLELMHAFVTLGPAGGVTSASSATSLQLTP